MFTYKYVGEPAPSIVLLFDWSVCRNGSFVEVGSTSVSSVPITSGTGEEVSGEWICGVVYRNICSPE